MEKPTIILVTISYPFTNSEFTFIEPEIDYLRKGSDGLFVISTKGNRNLPNKSNSLSDSNIIIPNTIENKFIRRVLNIVNIPLSTVRNFGIILNTIKIEGMISSRKIAQLVYMISLCDNIFKSIKYKINHLSIKSSKILIYSYWLSETSTISIMISRILKSKGFNVKIITRAHGYDIYKERSWLNWLPLQSYNIKHVDEIYACSENGEEYLKRNFPKFREKIFCAYLGVKDNYFKKIYMRKNIFKIVSCSSVQEIKRVDRILKALSLIKSVNIEWTHFGDGPDFYKLREESKRLTNKNIKIKLPGFVNNAEILELYKISNYNLFINVSETEGIPVSIMEAISFGLPVIATDVGGNSEICKNNFNGFLINKEFTNQCLAELILKIAQINKDEYDELCKNSRLIYEKRFNVDVNSIQFLNKVLDIYLD